MWMTCLKALCLVLLYIRYDKVRNSIVIYNTFFIVSIQSIVRFAASNTLIDIVGRKGIPLYIWFG